jgi:predicted kinase
MAEPAAIKERLESRRGDASDADWSVYLEAARRWQAPSGKLAAATHFIATDASRDAAVRQAELLLAAVS